MRNRVAAAAFTLAVACSPSSSSPPPPTGPRHASDPASVEGFCGAAAPAWCRWRDACAPGQARETASDCIVATLPACQRDFAALGREVEAGRYGWDPARARRCLDALEAPRCGDVLQHCEELFLPAVEPGGTCNALLVETDLAEVARRSECRGWPGGGEHSEGRVCPSPCGGTCPVPTPIGASCDRHAACSEDAYCGAPSGGPALCRARKAAASPCDDQLECAEGLWCRDADGTVCDYTDDLCACAADLSPGDACTVNSQCPVPLTCRDGICRPKTGAAGQSCYTFQADPPPCEPGLACVQSSAYLGTCGAPRGEGEPCLDGGDCADGLLCRTEGVCGRPSPEGGPCAPRTAESWRAYEGDCAPGLSCVGTSCVATPDAPGEACEPPTTYCYGAGVSCNPVLLQCEARTLELFASCAETRSCSWERGLYCATFSSGHRACVPRGGAGAACTAAIECLSLACGPDGRCFGGCGG